jgi:hypothetical protein
MKTIQKAEVTVVGAVAGAGGYGRRPVAEGGGFGGVVRAVAGAGGYDRRPVAEGGGFGG